MANPLKGEVSFEAENKEYILQYSNNALIELEDRLDRGIIDIGDEMVKWSADPKTVRLGTVRAIFWAGLREHHPDVDLLAAGELIQSAGGLIRAAELISKAFELAFPAPKTKGKNPHRRNNGTGLDS